MVVHSVLIEVERKAVLKVSRMVTRSDAAWVHWLAASTGDLTVDMTAADSGDLMAGVTAQLMAKLMVVM